MNLNRKTLLVVTLLIAASFSASNSALATAEKVSDVAPPPPRVENVPPRSGYIWAPGHWDWNGHAWTWIMGSYVYERRGEHWSPDHWEENGSQWRYVEGHWDR